jgi:hypothetical protein
MDEPGAHHSTQIPSRSGRSDFMVRRLDRLYYTQPWQGETRFMRTADRILEYACHEANYSLTYILQGARVRDGAQKR